MSKFLRNKIGVGVTMICVFALAIIASVLTLFFARDSLPDFNELMPVFLQSRAVSEEEEQAPGGSDTLPYFYLEGVDDVSMDLEEEETVYYNRPSEMRAVYLTAGVDFLTDSSESEQTVKEQIDAALDQIVEYKMNSVVIDPVVGSRVIYETESFPSSAASFDVLDYLIEACRERSLYVYVLFDVMYEQDDGEMREVGVFTSDTLDFITQAARNLGEHYAVDGIILDSYYYPETSQSYQDYLLYGGGIGYENYLTSVSEIAVETVSDALHQYAKGTQVGLLTDAVWENSSQNTKGSETSAEFTVYGDGNADTREFIRDGMLDFVMVKNYGSLEDPNADFLTVVEWWASITSQYDIPLYTLMAADKLGTDEPGWFTYDQLVKQVIQGREVEGFAGCVFNSLAALEENPKEGTTLLMRYYDNEVNPQHILTELAVTRPAQTTYSTFEQTVTFSGASDPNMPITCNGEELTTDQNGYFGFTADLKPGVNTFVFEHKDKTVTYTITRKVQIFKEYTPTGSLSLEGGMQLTVNALAYADANVTATLNGQTITLQITDIEDDSTDKDTSYAHFVGTFTMPAAGTSLQNLGNIVFYGNWEGMSETKTGALVKVNPKAEIGSGVMVQVVADQAETFPTSTLNDLSDPSYYPLPKGTKDYTTGPEVSYNNGKTNYYYYNLASGLRVYSSDIQRISGSDVSNRISGITVDSDSDYTRVILNMSDKASYVARYTGSAITFDFQYTTGVPDDLKNLTKNPLFTSATWSGSRLTLTLARNGGLIGYKAYYDSNDNLVLRFTNPPASFSDARIVVDPGHGYGDVGAVGFLPDYPEREINQMIAEKLTDTLADMGAEVTMIDTLSSKIDVRGRVAYAQNYNAHVLISVHANSAQASSAAGSEAYYFYPNGKTLATNAASRMASALDTNNRGGKFGRYYVTRDSQFIGVLSETGFVTNQSEYRKLLDDDYQQQVADALAEAVYNALSSAGMGTVKTGTQSAGQGVMTDEEDDPDSSWEEEEEETAEIEELSLSDEELYLEVGEEYELEVEIYPDDADGELEWYSSDPDIADVDSDGYVTAYESGSATITVESDSGAWAECEVEVG